MRIAVPLETAQVVKSTELEFIQALCLAPTRPLTPILLFELPHRRDCRILDLEPMSRPTGPVRRSQPLRQIPRSQARTRARSKTLPVAPLRRPRPARTVPPSHGRFVWLVGCCALGGAPGCESHRARSRKSNPVPPTACPLNRAGMAQTGNGPIGDRRATGAEAHDIGINPKNGGLGKSSQTRSKQGKRATWCTGGRGPWA